MFGLPFADIIFLGIVAAFIALRLRSVLGRKIGFDGSDAARKIAAKDISERVIQLPERNMKKAEEDQLALSAIGNPAVASGLAAIKSADPQFDLKFFLEGAKGAFDMVFDAFKKGDKATLKKLLGPDVYPSFERMIDTRTAASQKQDSTLLAVPGQEITEARLQGKIAQITVKFTSEQIHVVRDAAGKIVEGDPSQVEHVEDEWSFERDTTSRSPNWVVAAT